MNKIYSFEYRKVTRHGTAWFQSGKWDDTREKASIRMARWRLISESQGFKVECRIIEKDKT